MLRTEKNVRIQRDWSTGVVSETDQVPQIKTYKLEEKHRHNYLCAKIQTAEIDVLRAEGVH